MATVTVTSLSVEPAEGPLGDPVALDMGFAVDAPVNGGKWVVTYTVDMTGQRHIIELGETAPTDYVEGANTMSFSCAGIDLAGVKKSWLNNAGLLCATLRDAGGADIVQVSCVTMVRKDGDGFQRVIMSPLDE